MERVLGPDHRKTLATRYEIASCTGSSGHPAEALRLVQELLPGCPARLPAKLTRTCARGACDENVCATHSLSYRRNGMSIFVLLAYSGYALGKVAARFRSSTIPQ
jgi:hypothetical protein